MSIPGNRGSYAFAAVLIVAFLVVGLISYATITKGPATTVQNTFSTVGTGSLFVTPDQLILNLGVVTEASSASEALQSNSQQMDQVVKALKSVGLNDSELATSYFSIEPIYIYPKDAPPVLTGYRASNTITVSTGIIVKAGEYIDGAVKSGANRINFIYFTVSEQKQKQVKGDLISVAVEDAKAKANKALAPLALEILGVQSMSISDSGFPVVFLKGEQVPSATPILPGQQKVTVTVQIAFLIGTK